MSRLGIRWRSIPKLYVLLHQLSAIAVSGTDVCVDCLTALAEVCRTLYPPGGLANRASGGLLL